MDYKQMYKSKLMDVFGALSKVKSGDTILSYGVSSMPFTFFDNIHTIKDKVSNVDFITFNPAKPYDFFFDESYNGILNLDNLFFSRFCRESFLCGRTTYSPTHLRNSGTDKIYYLKTNNKPLDIYVVGVSPMDKHGYFSTGPVGMSNRDYAKYADVVILEINPNIPRTFGDSFIHITEADYIYEGEGEIRHLGTPTSTPVDVMIAENITELIEDGSTIQIGIGGIPSAVAALLKTKKDLGVHTEMFNDGIMELCNLGVINNSQKTLHKDKSVCTFTYGSEGILDYIDDNPGILHLDVAYCNSPSVLAMNKKMTSINTTLAVDLMGQCSSEAIGTTQISGTGGQVETAIGAKMSEGGKSIIAVRSTAMVKKEDSTERGQVSSIVPIHPAGTIVTLSRVDVDYVVTEYGVAALRGASLCERATQLIKIAHPDYREDLKTQAKLYKLL